MSSTLYLAVREVSWVDKWRAWQIECVGVRSILTGLAEQITKPRRNTGYNSRGEKKWNWGEFGLCYGC